MATMGKRISKRKAPAARVDKPFVDANTAFIEIVSPIQIEPIATQAFELPVLGVPIMREGFVTETGPLIRSAQPHASILHLQVPWLGAIKTMAFET